MKTYNQLKKESNAIRRLAMFLILSIIGFCFGMLFIAGILILRGF